MINKNVRVHARPSEHTLSSTANATLFFQLFPSLKSSLKTVINLKTFKCDYHMNDRTTFLYNQIKVYNANARILASGYKNAFFVFHVHGPVISHPAISMCD